MATPAVAGASVMILTPATAHEEVSLSFGKLIAGESPVVMTVSPDGTSHCNRAASCKGGASPAIFTLVGTPGARVGVSVSDHATLVADSGESVPVSLVLATDQVDLMSGQARIAVGGEIAVPAGQAPGQYRGEFHINIDYQ